MLITESEKTVGSTTVTDALNAASKGLSQSTKAAASVASSIGRATALGLSSSTEYVTETGKVAVGKSSELLREFSTSDTAKTLKKNSDELASKSSALASAGLDGGINLASAAGETTSKAAKSLWSSLSKKVSRGNDKSTS